MISSHVKDKKSKRIELTDEVRSKRENVEYVEKKHDSTRTCERNRSIDRLTKILYKISSSFIVEDFVVWSMREDLFCCFTTFVDFFVVCLINRTFRRLFLSKNFSIWNFIFERSRITTNDREMKIYCNIMNRVWIDVVIDYLNEDNKFKKISIYKMWKLQIMSEHQISIRANFEVQTRW